MATESIGINPRDFVLMLVRANEGSIAGRTILQKISYFAAEKLELDLGFKPHYYGPFSAEVENATEILVSQKLLEERIERLPLYDTLDFEPRRYHYELNEKGRKYIETKGLESQNGYEITRELIESARKLRSLNPKVLSAAAKIHYIISAEGRRIHKEEIKEKAEDIGWDLKRDEIDQVGDLLVSLGFLERVNE